tara:strand:- start:332 stop:1090 length:759 start_codon:yes stop_codon:yes gene_type:complete
MELLILTLAAFITSSISAVLGMGGGIILLGIMAIIIPEGYMVIALHGIIQLISNTTRTYIFKQHLKWDIINKYIIGAIIGLFISAFIIISLTNFSGVTSANEIKFDILKTLIGIFIIWYLFFKKKRKEVKNNKSFVGVGLISGIATVFVGASGPLIAPFFLNRNLTKNNLIATKAACQTITHFGKIPLFIFLFNFKYADNLYVIIPLAIAVFIGTKIGKKILGFIPEEIFIKLFKTTLFLIAVKLITTAYTF